MAKERLSMRKIREILRLKFDCKLSERKIAKSCSVARSTVGSYLSMAKSAGLTWPIPEHLSDTDISNMMFKNRDGRPVNKRNMPTMDYIHNELKKKSVTLQLLWYEYKQNNPDGYQLSYFCELYQKWAKKLDISLRQRHNAGEKLFIDYAGHTVPINDPKENCKKCWGRGYIGVEYKTNRPIACKCIYPKRTEAELLSESVTPNVRLSRSQRRKMDRYNKKLNKKGKK